MKSTLSLAALLLAAGVGAAEAARKPVAVSDAYDGTWSIEVITTSGPCDRAYRYGVKIEKGEARYPGADFNISGRVAGNGAVRATIPEPVAATTPAALWPAGRPAAHAPTG